MITEIYWPGDKQRPDTARCIRRTRGRARPEAPPTAPRRPISLRPPAASPPHRHVPLAAVAVCVAAGPLFAEDLALQDGLARLANKAAEMIREEGPGGDRMAVVMGDFLGAPRLSSSGGVGLAWLLARALEAQNVAVSDRAPFQIQGTFKTVDGRATEGDRFDSVALRIEAMMLDEKDNELAMFSINVFGDAPLQFSGATANLPPARNSDDDPRTLAEREKAKRQALEQPRAAIKGTEVRSSTENPYGVEVLVAKQPRTPSLQKGRAFVNLRPGEEFVVRLHNRTPEAAAVALTIDGLSMFAFSEEGDFGGRVLIPAGKSVEIPGWYITQTRTVLFETGSYGEHAAGANVPPTPGTGVITAMFARFEEGTNKDIPRSVALQLLPCGLGITAVKGFVKPTQAVVSVRFGRGLDR